VPGSATHVLAAAVGGTPLLAAAWWIRARWARRGLCDRLTGLANRKLFESRLAHAQLRANRHDYWVGVLTVDVDELATVNNTMGRECGDDLLRQVAARLTKLARDEDTIARLSSDEFAVLLEQVDSPTGAARAARRILDAFNEPLAVDGREVATSLSIGISVDRGGSRPGDWLVREAAIALSRAKARGKRRFETFEPPMGVEAAARLALEAELRQAVARDEFVVHYQPIVDLTTGEVTGAEALLRWAHPQRGLLFPADFIPTAESTGTIIPMGRWVLRTACRAAVKFGAADRARPDFRMSVNVSTRQFRDSHQLIEEVREALEDSGLPPHLLTLEITESSLLDDVGGAVDVVQQLRSMGVNVSLDDFGTGYSSLAYVKQIPVTGLKIDQSFVSELHDPATAAITRAIFGLAAELDITVTAEGVETGADVARLRDLGCRLVQGHYYSDALTEAALLRLISRVVPTQRTNSLTIDDPKPVRRAIG
jgi:diguanylate cyclase (GGDEF)-like protein